MPSRTPPLGYRWADATRTRYEHDPVWAPIVADLFHQCAAGASLHGLAEQLAGRGLLPPRGGRRWYPSTLLRILRHPGYCGEATALRYQTVKEGGRRVVRLRSETEQVTLPAEAMPALIDRDTFAAVQQRLDTNRQLSPRRLADPDRFLLRAGVVRCGYCGRSLRVLLHNGRQSPDYSCPSRPEDCSHRPSMVAARLDTEVWEQVLAKLSDEDLIAREWERRQKEAPEAVDLAAIEREQQRCARQEHNLVAAIASAENAAARRALELGLHALGDEQQRLATEHEHLVARRAVWQETQERLRQAQAWVRAAGEQLQQLAPPERRLAFAALGVEVRLFAASAPERWDLRFSVPVEGEFELHTTGSTRGRRATPTCSCRGTCTAPTSCRC